MNETENLYLSKISLLDEMPRLAAQAGLIKLALEPYLKTLQFQPAPGEYLDLGCGPGILTSFISKFMPGYNSMGIDFSPEMVQYASLSFPKIRWMRADIRSLPLEDAKFDFITCCNVLIHLRDSREAMSEIFRVLKPGGRVLIFNPNDSTFQGPPLFLQMIREHAKTHPGNRFVMDSLESVSKEVGFKTIEKRDITATNAGRDDAPIVEYPFVHLGKMTGWSMLSFMGQPVEMQSIYSKVQEEYMNNKIQFSVNMQIHLYTKV